MPTKKKTPPSRKKKVAAPPEKKLQNQKKLQKKSLKAAKKDLPAPPKSGEAKLLRSEVVYQGPLFRVTKDRILEPSGKESSRDVVRHNGSVIILAVDSSKSKRDPWIVMERQYRHAAGRFLWELPAGKLELGEDPLTGAQRELEEETGYRAKKWKPLVEYFASPGFLGETMKVYLAEGLVSGDAHPEDDEDIELRLIKLSDILKQIEKGAIMDGKTLSCVLLYARLKGKKG